MTSSSALMLVAGRSFIISNIERSVTGCLRNHASWFKIVVSRSYKCGTFSVCCTTSENGMQSCIGKFGSNNKSESRRFSYRPPPTMSPNCREWLPSSPLKCGSNSDTSLSSMSLKTKLITRSTSCSLIHSCNCSNFCKILRMSTLLISLSTKDINMSLHSFCNCNSF